MSILRIKKAECIIALGQFCAAVSRTGTATAYGKTVVRPMAVLLLSPERRVRRIRFLPPQECPAQFRTADPDERGIADTLQRDGQIP